MRPILVSETASMLALDIDNPLQSDCVPVEMTMAWFLENLNTTKCVRHSYSHKGSISTEGDFCVCCQSCSATWLSRSPKVTCPRRSRSFIKQYDMDFFANLAQHGGGLEDNHGEERVAPACNKQSSSSTAYDIFVNSNGAIVY